MITAHAGVPRWGAVPDVDTTGRAFVVVGDDGPITRRWVRQATRARRPCDLVDAAGLDDALRRATVGVRVMITGPEAEVLAVAARCRVAGLIDSELTLHATSTAKRRVYCPHCTATTLVTAEVDEVAACGGCGRPLLVFAHASARSGRYLGFQADAEEQA